MVTPVKGLSEGQRRRRKPLTGGACPYADKQSAVHPDGASAQRRAAPTLAANASFQRKPAVLSDYVPGDSRLTTS